MVVVAISFPEVGPFDSYNSSNCVACSSLLLDIESSVNSPLHESALSLLLSVTNKSVASSNVSQVVSPRLP